MSPAVYAGKPELTGGYDYKEVDGISIYLQKSAQVEPEGLKIDLKGIGMFKRLAIEGFMI